MYDSNVLIRILATASASFFFFCCPWSETGPRRRYLFVGRAIMFGIMGLCGIALKDALFTAFLGHCFFLDVCVQVCRRCETSTSLTSSSDSLSTSESTSFASSPGWMFFDCAFFYFEQEDTSLQTCRSLSTSSCIFFLDFFFFELRDGT